MIPLGIVNQQTLASTLLDGLVSWWAMEETGANNRIDSHGVHDLQPLLTPGNRSGIVGNAVDLNGINQYLTVVHTPDLAAGARDFSFATWVELDSLVGTDITFMSKALGGTPGPTTWEWQIGYDDVTANQFRFILGVGSSWPFVLASTFGTPTTGVKYHIYCEYKHSTNTMGISINAGTLDTTSSGGTPNTTTQSVYMGVFANLGQYLNGGLDEANFWARILTTDERSELYNSGSGITHTDL